MRKPSSTIKIDGLGDLVANLRDPELARQPVVELLEKASKLASKTAIGAISGGTGMAERSINHKVWARTLSARVYTMIAKPTAMSIEKGRNAGDPPSLKAVARWYKETPYPGALSREEIETVYRIQHAISIGGSRGKGYMVATKKAVENELPRLKDEALKTVERLMRF